MAGWSNSKMCRLLKRRFDPDGIFASAILLPEGQTGPLRLKCIPRGLQSNRILPAPECRFLFPW
jgi:hypothetical protein